jgi:hypothetical protein
MLILMKTWSLLLILAKGWVVLVAQLWIVVQVGGIES